MAGTSTYVAAPQVQALVATTYNYVTNDLLAEINEPDVWRKYIDSYGAGKLPLIVYMKAMAKTIPTINPTFRSYERPRPDQAVYSNATYAATSANVQRNVVLSASSALTNGAGTFFPIQPREVVRIPSTGQNCFVTQIDTGTTASNKAAPGFAIPTGGSLGGSTGNWAIGLQSYDNNGVGAITTGDAFYILTNVQPELSQPMNGFTPDAIEYVNTLQTIRDDQTYSALQLGTKSWMEVVGKDGAKAMKWWYEAEFVLYYQFLTKIENQIMSGDIITNSVLTGAGYTGSQGLLPFVRNNGGLVHPYGVGNFTSTDWDEMCRYFSQNAGTPEYTGWAGFDAFRSVEAYLQARNQNTNISYTTFDKDSKRGMAKAADFNFSSFSQNGYSLHMRDYNMWNNPLQGALPGQGFPGLMLLIPSGDGLVGVDGGKDEMMPYFNLRTQTADPTDGRTLRNGYEQHWMTGGAAPIPTDGQDGMNSHYICKIAAHPHSANKWAILQN